MCKCAMFTTVVLSGGAVPALSFFGGLQYLRHVGALDQVGSFVGSSAGAVVALLSVLGFSPDEACDFIMEVGVRKHRVSELDVESDGSLLEWCCLETLGLDSGQRWVAFLGDAMQARLGRRDATFRELGAATGKVLVVCVTNLTRRRREYLSVDGAADMSVVTAVRMSMSVPFLYTPVLHDGCVYVDGAVLDNFPVARCEGQTGGPPTTIAFHLCPDQGCDTTSPPQTGQLPGPWTYAAMLFGAVMDHAQRHNGACTDDASGAPSHVARVGVPMRPDEVSTCGFNMWAMSFDITRDRLDSLVARGYSAARAAIEPLQGAVHPP